MTFIEFIHSNINKIHQINQWWFSFCNSIKNNRSLNILLSESFVWMLKYEYDELIDYDDTTHFQLRTKGDFLYAPTNTIVESKSNRSLTKDIDFTKPLEYGKINNRNKKTNIQIIQEKSFEIPEYIMFNHFNPQKEKSTIAILSTLNSELVIDHSRIDIVNLNVEYINFENKSILEPIIDLKQKIQSYIISYIKQFEQQQSQNKKVLNKKTKKTKSINKVLEVLKNGV